MPAVDDRPIVAAFDVDGTLTTRDCVVPFLRRTVGVRGAVVALARRPLMLLKAAAARNRDAIKALAVAGFAGRDADDVTRQGEDFAEAVEHSWLRPDSSARLAWHLTEGHEVVLVSASLEAYLVPLGRRLGVTAVLGTILEVDGFGRLTGRLGGANCRGAEKVRRLDEWLSGRDVELWAYGDSVGDRELLARADHPHLIKGVVIDAVPPRSSSIGPENASAGGDGAR